MEDHNNPENWRWGIFYANPSDKRIIVPKRVPGMGFTINFGNPFTGLYLAFIAVGMMVFFFIRDYVL